MTATNSTSVAETLAHEGVALAPRGGVARYQVEGLSPQTVARPADVEQLASAIRVASRHEVAVAPLGGNTRSTLGNPIERLDLVVDTTGLDRVVDHNPADLTATVEAGITVSKLQEELAHHGQFLAVDPPLPDRATVGGTLAVGFSGPLKWQYGNVRDVVIGMKVVQGDGLVTKSGGQVVKNVSGYDMSRLHVGGLGTLGVIAEVSFKLTPLPAGEGTLAAFFDSIELCVEAGLKVFQSDVLPLAITAVDGTLAAELPGVGGTGKCVLAIRLGGRPQNLERQFAECRSICREHSASEEAVVSEADGAAVWRAIADFAWEEQAPPLLAARALVQPSIAATLARELVDDGSGGLDQSMVAHPAQGVVLMAWREKAGNVTSDDTATLVLNRTRDAVHRYNGRLIVERCPTGTKTALDVWDDVGESIAIMRRLKEQYDPKRTLNPGRYAAGI